MAEITSNSQSYRTGKTVQTVPSCEKEFDRQSYVSDIHHLDEYSYMIYTHTEVTEHP